MPTHAILGATGGTGSAILRCLLSSNIPDLQINILVRSKGKLLGAFPDLESTSRPSITIFEGSISDEDTLKACVKGASTIYVRVATNVATKTVDIAVTTAARLVAALGSLHNEQGSQYTTPVVLFNRSLSLNSDVVLPVPHFAKRFTTWALWSIYEDLLGAGELYAEAKKDGLLALITADPPSLMELDKTETTGYEIMERGKSSLSISYTDLGIAMVELGQRREEFGGKTVGVSATGKVQTSSVVWFVTLFKGLLGKVW